MPTVVPVSAEAAACFRSKILVSRNAASNQTMADTIATTTSMLKDELRVGPVTALFQKQRK
jgi:hypothetical protein